MTPQNSRLGRTAGMVINRLVVGIIFAVTYQTVTAAASLALGMTLTGTLQDLITGLESGDRDESTVVIVWWAASTMLFTTIAIQIVRFRKWVSPYRGESMNEPPKITIVSLLILGAMMSFLFFVVNIVENAIIEVSMSVAGEYGLLAIKTVSLIAGGFVVVGIIGRARQVKRITRNVGAVNIDDFIKKFSKTSDVKTTADTLGLAPGTLIHVGKKRVDKTLFSALRYNQSKYTEISKTDNRAECLEMSPMDVNWINVTGVHDAEQIKWFGETYGLHELQQADIMNTEIRPTAQIGADNIFVILKMPRHDKDGNLLIEHISMVLGSDYVISFQEDQDDVFDRVRDNIRESHGEFRNMGSDYLAYALIDAIVDNFFIIMERISEQTESLEQKLMSNPGPETLQVIYTLKRQLVMLRKVIWPMREAINSLERSDSSLIQDTTKKYLRDIYNHTVQTMDTIESLRDMVGGMLDTYLSSISNKMNEVMKTLTIIASIFIPITFIAGIYGTNFAHIPELQWEGGYYIMLIMMGTISGIMLAWFKRKGWL